MDRHRPTSLNARGSRPYRTSGAGSVSRHAAELAVSAGGREADIPPDAIDLEALSDAVRAVRDEAADAAAGARERGDHVAYGAALRRLAEAVFYEIGMACRLPLAYREHYDRAVKARERMGDPDYAQYQELKKRFEGEGGTVPVPHD